ncbi:hypothetical protein Tco_0762451 [Tanacetum coccineum]
MYFSKLKKSRKCENIGFRVISSVCTTDSNFKNKWLKDRVINELNVRVFKLETIIQVLARERNDEVGFNEVPEKMFGLEEAKRLRLEEEKTLQIAKDLSRLFHLMDTVWLTDDIKRFLGQLRQLKCNFPWSNDYTVDRNFQLTLVCLDLGRKGWLSEEARLGGCYRSLGE